ncbi:MAG: iron-sulfur cluster assembly scaffold protein [Cyclobacteriaceae bacterium]|nr:iron-sulfur cluster assembly scaffold protein [Cyclobacteriaceae bacterium]
MNREEIERLYKELIIPESKAPYRFEKKDGTSVLAYNPVCGDKFKIFTDGEVHFHGHGCALSKASGSLLMKQLEQRHEGEAKEIIHQFVTAVKSGTAESLNSDSLSTLVALKNYDGREDCILLTWNAMLNYLETK